MSDNATAIGFSTQIDRGPEIVVVRCRGRLLAGSHDSFYGDVQALFSDRKRIVLDLTELTHMDSSGLGTVIRIYVSAKSAGCELQLVNLGPRIRQVFGIANLMSFFTIIGENDIRML
jgi:anti-sigma B factor antagonist